MPTQPPPLGSRAEFVRTVEQQHTLRTFLDHLPPVLSTPVMIGWMEGACYLAADPYCEPGETTVGTAIHVTHRAPTGIGEVVTCDAVLESIEGRFYIYRVSARTARGLIGEGTVHRAFVHIDRFNEKLR